MDAQFPLNTYLNNLASFLMDSHSLKRVTIFLDIDERTEEWGYGMMLYPLRRLRNIRNVQCHGAIPDQYRLRLIQDMQSSEPAYTTLQQMRLLLSETSPHIQLIQSLVLLDSQAIEEAATTSCIGARVTKGGLHIECIEENLQAKLGQLEGALNRIDLQHLQSILEKAQTERNARNQANKDPIILKKAMRKWEGHLEDEGWKYTDGIEDWPSVDS
ncbi:hypothetical protein BST61_g2377 [Cercospora zeina]